MNILSLTQSDIAASQALVNDLKTRFKSAVEPDLLEEVRVLSSDLPWKVKIFFKNLKYSDKDNGIYMVRGFPVKNLMPTPSSWNYPESYSPNLDIDYFAVLISSIVGDLFGWDTQQNGKLIHDIIPIKGKEEAQTGYGSGAELILHTEDSFHKHRGDYVMFYCLRNDEAVNSSFCSIREISLPEEFFHELSQSKFSIKPDDSHLDKQQTKKDVSTQYIHELAKQQSKTPLIYGNKMSPYLCYDPSYTVVEKGDEKVLSALDWLAKAISGSVRKLPLMAGDVCILDNRKVVHGREGFQPNYECGARWLKRINVTSYLRKSADSRKTMDSRLIGEPLASTGVIA